jgi:predicted porin
VSLTLGSSTSTTQIHPETGWVRMASGNVSGSRWGLRGVEDLGGGTKALNV